MLDIAIKDTGKSMSDDQIAAFNNGNAVTRSAATNGEQKLFYQTLISQSDYGSKRSLRLNFGIRLSKKVDSLIVKWTSDNLQSVMEVKSNGVHLIEEKD